LYGVIASVVLLPLLVFAFYAGVTAISTFVGGAVLYVAEPLLTFVRAVCGAIDNLPLARLEVRTTHWWGIIFYLLGLIILSRFVFIDKKIRLPLAAVLFACYSATLVV
jgi:hypothetical protein